MLLEEIKSANKAVGLKQSLRAVESDSVTHLYIADDAEERVVRNIRELALAKNIEVINIESMAQLGKACGISVGAAVACILKQDK